MPTRDSNGRFVNGNPGGPGRKPREVERAYLQTMESIVSGEVWETIVKKAAEDAMQGDAKARTWLSGYMLGMPISRVEEPEGTNKVQEAIEAMYAAQRKYDQAQGQEEPQE